MLLRKYGAQCSQRNAESFRHGGMIALAALLLACVLMAGAVSAEGIITITPGTNIDSKVTWTQDGSDGYSLTISASGDYKLASGFSSAGTDTSAIAIQITSSGITLDGNHQLIQPASRALVVNEGLTNINVKNLNVISTTSENGINYPYAVDILSPTTFENNVLDFSKYFYSGTNDETAGIYVASSATGTVLKGNTITIGNEKITHDGVRAIGIGTSGSTIEKVEILNNILTLKNVGTATNELNYGTNGIYLIGVKTANVTGNTITSESTNGAGNRGILIDAVEEGNSYEIKSNTFDLKSVTTSLSSKRGAVLSVVDWGSDNKAAAVTMSGNIVKAAEGAFYLSSKMTGIISGNDFDAISANNFIVPLSPGVADLSSINWGGELRPGVNGVGIAWTGDAGGLELTISEAGSYKLIEDFTATNIKIVASDVTLNGNSKQITAPQIIIDTTDVTLENLNLTQTTGTPATTYAVQVTGDGNTGNITVKNSKITPVSDGRGFTVDTGANYNITFTGNTVAAEGDADLALAIYINGYNKNYIFNDNVVDKCSDKQFGFDLYADSLTIPVDISKNYWGGSIPTMDLFKKASSTTPKDLSLTYLPYYTKLNDDGSIDTNSITNAVELTPGVETDGVKWYSTTDNDKTYYALDIQKSGNYKLSSGFTSTNQTKMAGASDGGRYYAIMISASGVTLDGNKQTVAVRGGSMDNAAHTNILPLLVAKDASDVTIENLILTSSNNWITYQTVVKTYGTGTTFRNNTFDFSQGSVQPNANFITLYVSEEAVNAKIQNNIINIGSSNFETTGIVVNKASGVEITKNQITGKTGSAKYNGVMALGLSGSDTLKVSENIFDTSGVTGSMFSLNGVVALTASENTLKGGAHAVYAQGSSGDTVTVTGTFTKNNIVTISGKAIDHDKGVTLITGGLTWTNNIEPAIPEIPSVTPTKNVDGTASVTPNNNGDTSIEGTTATIGDSTSSAAVIQISGDGVKRDENTGAITAPPSAEIKAVYNPATAATVSSDSAVTYQLNISLKDTDALDELQLPTISPAFDQAKASLVISNAPGFTPLAMITATGDLDTFNTKIKDSGIELTFTVPMNAVDAIGKDKIRAFHVKNGNVGDPLPVTITEDGNNYLITVKGSSFSTYALAASSAPVSSDSSSSGNTENAFRVLFETSGGSFVQPATGLSYGDRIAKPADPERSGYSFAGWYKDEAGTIAWVFSEDAVPGDTSLYAKWVPAGSSVSATEKTTEKATAAATASTTVKQTTAPTTVAATTAATAPAGISPTMTQAPVPLAGLLFGLLGGCVLIRRRE